MRESKSGNILAGYLGQFQEIISSDFPVSSSSFFFHSVLDIFQFKFTKENLLRTINTWPQIRCRQSNTYHKAEAEEIPLKIFENYSYQYRKM